METHHPARMAVTSIAVVATVTTLALGEIKPLGAQQDSIARPPVVTERSDSVTIRLVDVDLRAAVQALSRYVDQPVLFGGTISGNRVTLETPRPVPRSDVPRLLRGLLESQGMELVTDSASGAFLARPRQQVRVEPPRQSPAETRQGTLELFVIQLRHARAADVAATVNSLYGRGSSLGEVGGRRGTLNDEIQRDRIPPAGFTPPEAVVGLAGRDATLRGEVTIVPDPSTNSLLIRATRDDFTLISAAVREVDVRPLQVLIEVLIAEVRRDRSLSFGVDLELPPSRVRGSDNTVVSGATTGLGLGDFVLRVMGIGGVDVNATLRAAAARGDVTIMSRPIVLAANNEEAEIMVGSQRPFVQVQRALPTDAPVRDQVIQYRDVGTQLHVRPTISADGYVMLDVTQQVNAATTETAFDAPVISTRSVSTRLLIKDGQTIVLGGLSDRQRDNSQGGIPFLSSIPIFGGLFGRTTRRATETELFLFLTPRVIRGDEDVSSVTAPLQTRSRANGP